MLDDKEIVNRINQFDIWQYQFDLKGHLTPIRDKPKINRHGQRVKYFFDPLVSLLGGSLAGKRILDLGCNAGFWSLLAIQHGCARVVGIDGRQMHVDQANFVFSVHEIPADRFAFIQANVFDIDFKSLGSFDIVFCLGLLYHVSKPMELIEKIASASSDILVIDTRVAKGKGSFIEIRHEDTSDPRHAYDHQLVFRPSRLAVAEMAGQFGYRSMMLKPRFDNYEGAQVYKKGTRRAFICAKQTELAPLAAVSETIS
jgi:SAM-dependent methyltransferase